ncbi:MAG: SPFH domain-containing protein [Planctomycetota bacterium]|nr:SPFH domain-containing protein [Planctomycetota bacterium]MDA1179954.1 SPFH domain-containing protein [Planctomycetota bacterium]
MSQRALFEQYWKQLLQLGAGALAVLLVGTVAAGYVLYNQFRIDVPSGKIAVLIKRTGLDLSNDLETAPDITHKGLQTQVLTEGRYFYNPYTWEWHVYPMVEIPQGKMGVRIRLVGEDLPYGQFVTDKSGANADRQKGIVAETLNAGRYPINAMVKGYEEDRPRTDYVEVVELHDPVTIPAGFRGVVTNLAGPMPENPNVLLVEPNFRGVQKEALEPGTYYLNPYMYRINAVDCRSQRFNLGDNKEMGFPSRDGFWVSLDGIIEFRVKPEMASEVYVIYNEINNDDDTSTSVDDEIVRKVIMPNARSFCRLQGSNSSGREFIEGKTRVAFQAAFQEAIRETCSRQGIDVVQALVTRINPPQAIATPVRTREVARQRMGQFDREILQQDAEAKLAIERALIEQKQQLVGAEQQIVQKVVKASQEQEVAITKAKENLAVAKRDLDATKDRAAAMLANKQAEAGVVHFENEASAAGWRRSVAAFQGNGHNFARYVMYQKIAPSFRQIVTNTAADSPLMSIFQQFAIPHPTNNPAVPGPSTTPTSVEQAIAAPSSSQLNQATPAQNSNEP